MADAQIVTGAFGIGTAFHSLLLEPDNFAETYGLLPTLNLRTNAGKAELEGLLSAEPGKLWLKAGDMTMLYAMAAGALEHPEANEILSQGGDAEVSFYGTRDGVRTKVRVDWVMGLDGIGPLTIVDVKTTQDASPAAFKASVISYNYAAQQAWYISEVERVTGRTVADFLFLVVEKNWPYHAGVYRLGEALAEDGEAIIAEAWEKYCGCKARDQWPHYGDGGVMVL